MKALAFMFELIVAFFVFVMLPWFAFVAAHAFDLL